MHPKQQELRLDAIGFELLQEENPVEASRYGKNTVFHYCEPNDRRASYAGCLHTLEAVYDGRAELVPECAAAINAGTCEAVNKRKLELKEGRALFYVDYVELTARRKAQNELEAEQSTNRYGKPRKSERKWVPTEVKLLDEPKVSKAKPVEAPVEIQTNIMEQVLKKRLENDNINTND